VQANRLVNRDFLLLEIIALLVNAAIAWLLLMPRSAARRLGASAAQRAVLWLVAINLTAMLLFPPCEYAVALSHGQLPTFDGFHFLFGDNRQQRIVTAILAIEIAALLVNAALLWLLFEERSGRRVSAGQ
jgi:hypothetical protein